MINFAQFDLSTCTIAFNDFDDDTKRVSMTLCEFCDCIAKELNAAQTLALIHDLLRNKRASYSSAFNCHHDIDLVALHFSSDDLARDESVSV